MRTLLASCIALLLIGSSVHAASPFPLTRDEPLVRMVLQEAVHEPDEGLVAVAGVALDRVLDRRWPDSVSAVVYQPKQFTAMAYKFGTYTQANIIRARAAVFVARIYNTRPCGTVLWYHTVDVKPKWRLNLKEVCRIGRHIFYGDK